MGSKNFKPGDVVYLLADKNYKRCLRKKERKKGSHFIPLKVLEVITSAMNNDETPSALLLIGEKRHFKRGYPYGGHGIIESETTKRLLTKTSFEWLSEKDEEEIGRFCEETSFSNKEILHALKLWRNKAAKQQQWKANLYRIDFRPDNSTSPPR